MKCSKAGKKGYDIEWQGMMWRFHEHCQTAIEEAHDKILLAAWDSAMGGVVYKNDKFLLSLGYEGPDAYLRDENGIPITRDHVQSEPDDAPVSLGVAASPQVGQASEDRRSAEGRRSYHRRHH